MAKVYFNEANREVIDEMLLELPGVEPGKAFGYPGYYVNGKMFACMYGDGISIKVPEETARELLERPEVSPVEPMEGRVMKQWVLVEHEDPEDFKDDFGLLKSSLEYVDSLTRSKGGR